MKELIEEFYADTQSHVESVEETLLKLDKDPSNAEFIDDVFRRVHSVKGNAGVLGFSEIHAEGTKLETLLEAVRERKSVEPGEMDVLFAGLDALKDAVNLARYGKTDAPEKPARPPRKEQGNPAPQSSSPTQPQATKVSPAVQTDTSAETGPQPELAAEKKDKTPNPASETRTFLTFTLDAEKYGLAIMDVREIILIESVTPVPNTKDFVEGVMNLRDQIIPVFSLKRRLGMADDGNMDETEKNIVVVEISKSATGLKVDEVTGIVNIHSKNITPPDRFRGGIPTDFLHGIGDTPDGVIILLNSADICDPEGLLY